MGAGRRRIAGSYVTDVIPYRTVTGDDTDIDDVEEIIDLRFTDEGNDTITGADKPLYLYVFLRDGVTTVDITLFVNGAIQRLGDQGGSSDISMATSEYAKVGATATVTENTLLIFDNLPANEYKVMATGGADYGEVLLREQHMD